MSKYPGRIVSNLAPAGYSVFFDGTGDYLTVPSNVALTLSTGSFTLEFWVYPTNFSSATRSWLSNRNGTETNRWGIDSNTSGAFYLYGNGSAVVTSAVFTANQWLHVCVTRANTSTNGVRLFVNGKLEAVGTSATDFAADIVSIGASPSGSQPSIGYMSNVRIIKGAIPSEYSTSSTTVGTQVFIPPTQLLNVTNTVLLTCNSPAIIDQSTNNFTITANGNAAVSTLTPFTAYVPYNPALGASTPGIWTLDEALQAAATRQWNMYDPSFNLTTLLLHGNGTNGAQNNTFLDSSSNNFTITRNGNTTQGSFSPFSQVPGYWSNYFDGSGDYLSAAYNSAYALPGDFTIEFLVNWSAHGASAGFVTNMQSSGGAPAGWQVIFNGANDTVSFEITGSYPFITSSITLPRNAWTHVAVVRSGSSTNNVRMYFNGVQVAQGTNTSTLDSTNASLFIGCERTGGAFITGYISNVRIVKGTAVYTTAFTPPAAPLTAITNTSLLTCQSNRFIDNSSNAFAITRNGDVSVQAFSPFYPTAAYTPQTIGGSGFFDGTGDYLTVADNPALEPVGNNFCIEISYYPTSVSGNRVLIGKRVNPSTDYGFLIFLSGATVLTYISSANSSYDIANGNNIGTLVNNQWHHIAIFRVGNAWYASLNGAITTLASNNSLSVNNNPGTWAIGADSNGGTVVQGYISNVRFVIGSSVYSSTSAPFPTAPLTAITNTQLLLNYTNAGITDATAKNVLETVGNAQISTTQSKFGGSSMYFDGTGDWLLMPDTPDLELESGDFTIEAWVYLTALNTERTIVGKIASQAVCGAYVLEVNSSNVIKLFASNNTSTWQVSGLGTATISQNTWTHVAATRSGSTFTVWVNGVSSGTATASFTLLSSGVRTSVGAFENGALPWLGYIEELRITKGFARYTGAFTPQTSQWQDQ